MSSAPSPARRHRDRDIRRRVLLVIGGFALAVMVRTGLSVVGDFDAVLSGRPAQATPVVAIAEAPIIFAGNGSQTTEAFYLAGGTYRGDWSAWGEAPEYPPCTHSAHLMAVDPANGKTSRGDVTDLANLVDVPATGASNERFVYDVKPGDYYVDVTSACAWQIALSPN